MDWSAILQEVCREIELIAKHDPKERLPKEEQVRCVFYRLLHEASEFVQVEARYKDVDTGGSGAECDIRAKVDGKEWWVEIKGESVADAPAFYVKRKERLEAWKKDIDKLKNAPDAAKLAFVLVGLRQVGHSLKNFAEDQIVAVGDYVRKQFPDREPNYFSAEHQFAGWREIRPAEIKGHVWSW